MNGINKSSIKQNTSLEFERIDIPPINLIIQPPKRQIVFVDPEDIDHEWWWPAIIVSKEEFKLFQSTHDHCSQPLEGEYLVVYFEDGSLYYHFFFIQPYNFISSVQL